MSPRVAPYAPRQPPRGQGTIRRDRPVGPQPPGPPSRRSTRPLALPAQPLEAPDDTDGSHDVTGVNRVVATLREQLSSVSIHTRCDSNARSSYPVAHITPSSTSGNVSSMRHSPSYHVSERDARRRRVVRRSRACTWTMAQHSASRRSVPLRWTVFTTQQRR